MKVIIQVVVLTMALLQVAPAAEPGEPLLWVGCGITKKAFMTELAKAYTEKYGTPIQIEGGGATKGIRMAANLSADFGGSCRRKIDDSLEEASAKLVPVAWDALVVIVHPDNPVDDITLDQVRAIYEGRITNWSALGGPDRPLELMYRRGKYSGVGRTLRELVFNDTGKEFVGAKQFPSSGPLEKAVEATPTAIAITGISSARKRHVKLLKLEGKAPDYDNIRSGDYLLYRPLYIAYNPLHPRASEIRRFLDFAHTGEGRAIIRNQGVVPYMDAVKLTFKQREQWRESRAQGGLR